MASSVGLEITPTTLRAVEVRLHARQTIIERLAETETPEGSVLNGRVTDPEAVGYALRRLWDRARAADLGRARGCEQLPLRGAGLYRYAAPPRGRDQPHAAALDNGLHAPSL